MYVFGDYSKLQSSIYFSMRFYMKIVKKKVENLKNTITCKSAVTKSRLDIIYSVYRTKKQVEFRKSDK